MDWGGAFFCFSPLFFAPSLVKIILPGFLSLFPSSLTKLVFYLSAVFTLLRNHNRHPCRCVRPLPSIPSPPSLCHAGAPCPRPMGRPRRKTTPRPSSARPARDACAVVVNCTLCISPDCGETQSYPLGGNRGHLCATKTIPASFASTSQTNR